MERLTMADNPSTQKRILEVFAKDLPISNRYVKYFLGKHLFLYANNNGKQMKCQLNNRNIAH